MRNVESIEVGYGEALQFGVSQGTYYKEPEQLLTEAYEAGKREQTDELEAARADAKEAWEKLSEQCIAHAATIQQLAAEQSLARLRNQVRDECAGVCDRFAEREMHPAECAAAIRAMKEPE